MNQTTAWTASARLRHRFPPLPAAGSGREWPTRLRRLHVPNLQSFLYWNPASTRKTCNNPPRALGCCLCALGRLGPASCTQQVQLSNLKIQLQRAIEADPEPSELASKMLGLSGPKGGAVNGVPSAAVSTGVATAGGLLALAFWFRTWVFHILDVALSWARGLPSERAKNQYLKGVRRRRCQCTLYAQVLDQRPRVCSPICRPLCAHQGGEVRRRPSCAWQHAASLGGRVRARRAGALLAWSCMASQGP